MSKLIQDTGFFKHVHTFTGYAGSTPYIYSKGGGALDGLNTLHVNLYARCDTCNKEVLVAKTHTSKDGILNGMKPKL